VDNLFGQADMANGTCSVPGCGRTGQTRHGMCDPHYRRWKRNGDPGPADIKTPAGSGRACIVEGCGRIEPLRNDMCQKHYLRVKATGGTDDPEPVTHCPQEHEYTPANTRIHRGKRHCIECSRIAKREAYARDTPAPCSVDGCETPARKRGWCGFHFDRWQQFGDPLAGEAKRSFAKLSPEDKAASMKAAARKYHETHREQIAARKRQWQQENWEAVRAATTAWREQNRARWNALVYESRRRRLGRIGPDPERVDREAILAEFGMVCHICTREIADRSDLEFDHVIPIARGGTETYGNLRPSHKRCNRSKGAKLMSELGGGLRGDALHRRPGQDADPAGPRAGTCARIAPEPRGGLAAARLGSDPVGHEVLGRMVGRRL